MIRQRYQELDRSVVTVELVRHGRRWRMAIKKPASANRAVQVSFSVVSNVRSQYHSQQHVAHSEAA
jgi:hypothetical protein